MRTSAPIDIFTALDLEMNQPSGSIISIGAVIGSLSSGDILHRVHLHVNCREEINPMITDLTGIRQQDVDVGVSLREAYDVLRATHVNYKSFINPITWGGGDAEAIRRQLPVCDPWCFGRRWIDVKTLFVSMRLANGDPIQGGLAKSMTKVGLKFEGRKHCALDDAENTFRMYRQLLTYLKR